MNLQLIMQELKWPGSTAWYWRESAGNYRLIQSTRVSLPLIVALGGGLIASLILGAIPWIGGLLGIVTILGSIGAWWFYLRPRFQVDKNKRGLRASFSNACENLSLGRRLRSDNADLPFITEVDANGGTVEVRIRIATGETINTYQKAGPALAAWAGMWRALVRVDQPGYVKISFQQEDPLAHAQVPLPNSQTGTATDPIFCGLTEFGTGAWLNLAEPATHCLVLGSTRSGKSVFTYSTLFQLAGRPDVIIGGVDPTGILFAPFRASRHAAWQSSGTANMEDAADCLDRLVDEMDRRNAWLAENYRDKIDTFTPDIPMIICILEEFAGITKAAQAQDAREGRKVADRIANRIESSRSRLLAESAKAGIRVITILQRGDAAILGGYERSQMLTKIIFRVDSANSLRMAIDDLPPDYLADGTQSAPGIAITQSPALTGYENQVIRIRSPFIPDYQEYVNRVHAALGTTTGGTP